MTELLDMANGTADLANCRPEWIEAGIVVGSELHPVAGGMIAVALDAPRSASFRRFDGVSVAPLFVGVDRRGRATLTEWAGPDTTPDCAAITATRLELLPALVMQALRLHPGLPSPGGRSALKVTAKDLQDVLARLEQTATIDTGAVELETSERLLLSFENGWQAAGGWQRSEPDTFATVLNAGPLGLWSVKTDRVEPGGSIEPSKPVRLVPCTVAEATEQLGDVITGRRAPRPSVATA